ncbi:MAG TPA: hypothetical protein PLS03_13305, partial [Terrimicrobiaceae bacterium]|nr:hypothetical protein [Terrimicrobiaceae bacterium]
TRRYGVAVDGELLPNESGQHRAQGWGWEQSGTVTLDAGRHVVALRDVTKHFARTDMIVFAPPGFDPAKVPLKSLQQHRIKPVPAEGALSESASAPRNAPSLEGAKEVAVLESAAVRLAFLQTADGSRLIRQVSVKENGAWRVVPGRPGEEQIFMLFDTGNDIAVGGFLPFWNKSQPIRFTVNGREYITAQGLNPFSAGELTELVPVAVQSASPQAVELACEGRDGTKATAVWTLDGECQRLTVALTAGRAGNYSVGFSPFSGWQRSQVRFVQLPPLFQMQRLPRKPVMVSSNTTPQALALVEVKPENGGGPFTFVAAADPADLPFAWPHRSNSRYGFSLLNPYEQVQPTVFRPVLDLEGSRREEGETLESRFVALALPGDWKAGLQAASDRIFRVTDYREPVRASLTEAALNMIDLIKDADASGWDAKLKGHYNIESAATVTHATPLTFLSVAMLTRDPQFYADRALPTLEYTLSRRSTHYAVVPPKTYPAYLGEEETRLTFPGRSNGVKYWQGVYDLTQKLNPWIADMARQNSKLLARKPHEIVPQWTEMLGEYQLDPSPEKLAEVRTAADAWIAKEVYGPQTAPKGIQPFYNFHFYPYWWDLLDLYELTGEKKYLAAAEEGGFHTMAGLWSQPSIPEGKITANAGGQFAGVGRVWWKGDKEYRLGTPRQPGDTPEREVPAWEVAQMGLGLEQPSTYFAGGTDENGFGNILNSGWAPSLLRLYQLTGRDIYKTYARNTIIARFANYPGYYLKGFTDVQLTKEFPYKGPDVTSIYYHHIPVQLAFTLDYLFAEAEQMSQGAVRFPWVRQQGYVWFTNREYGSGPGTVYGDEGLWPWLDRAAFSVDAPQINYLGASGNGKFVVIVTNSSHHVAKGKLTLDPARTGVVIGQPYEFLINGKPAVQGKAAKIIPFQLPVGAVGVFRFSSAKPVGFISQPPLAAKPVTVPLPKPWDQLNAMRIRSPFGQDSLYVFATNIPPAGSSAKVIFEGGKLPDQTVSAPPFEFT